ncbi:uncharacterized protein [Coffea arabica]|uniref:Uncharacterized protein isoform X2 n=1 Tax=Coffea arabica TaxID=13443 RepID=A0A6P6XGG5_COFAR|nr:uncharacterized protein LOC113743003 isoform X2 [Coffea arabica]
MLTCLLQALPLGPPRPNHLAGSRKRTELAHCLTSTSFHLRPSPLPLFLPADDRTWSLMCSPSPSNSPSDLGNAKKEQEEETHEESVLDSVIKFVADSLIFSCDRLVTAKQPDISSILAMLLLLFQSTWMATWWQRMWKLQTRRIKKKSYFANWEKRDPVEVDARQITKFLWWMLFFHNLFGHNNFYDLQLMIYVGLCDCLLEQIFFAWKGLFS